MYPAYASYKAVLSRDPEAHKQWLCYWCVVTASLSARSWNFAINCRHLQPHLIAYSPARRCRVVNALFVVFELIGDTFISWLPLYYEGKLIFIWWLTLQRGATVLYDNLVHKYLERYEPDIDAGLASLQQSADAAFEGLKVRAVRHLRHGSRTILQAGGAALAELAMATATTAALEQARTGGATPAAAGMPDDAEADAIFGGAAAAAVAAFAGSAAAAGGVSTPAPAGSRGDADVAADAAEDDGENESMAEGKAADSRATPASARRRAKPRA